MTHAEFDALSRLLPGTPGAARDAARRVLVDGLSVAQAAREVGITHAAVSRLVARLRELQQSGCPTCGRPAMEG